VLDALQSLAPLEFAEPWDNVGLLLSPSKPRPIDRILLTIDLTRAVVDEAVARKTRLIVAYHPVIFEPVKRVDGKLATLIENRIAVYSPHTALDAAPGGVNDWLADGLVPAPAPGSESERAPLVPQYTHLPGGSHKLVVFVPTHHVDRLRDALAQIGCGGIGNYTHCSFNLEGYGTFLGNEQTHPVVGMAGRLERVPEIRLEMLCSLDMLPTITSTIRRVHPYEEPAWEVYPIQPVPRDGIGQGRLITLKRPVTLSTLLRRIRQHLNLPHLRVAAPEDVQRGRRKITTIAVCPGAGGSLFKSVAADAYLTGEMRHHDVLAKREAGSAVVLTDHTNTERGYLPTLRDKLRKLLGKSVKIELARNDRDPLNII
jgi:dinuclear metal center YbgI/SA1388 family protein